MAVSVWLAIAWLFINWFPHNALHMNAGIDVWRTIVIDFTFHVTLIVAGCFTAYAFVSRSVSNRLPSNHQANRPMEASLIGEPAAQGERAACASASSRACRAKTGSEGRVCRDFK